MTDRTLKPHLPTVSLQPTTPGEVNEARQAESTSTQAFGEHDLSISRAKAMAVETEKIMIRIVQGGNLPTTAAELKIPISALNQQIALYGLRAARICNLKGVSKGVVHGTMARCDTGPNPTLGFHVPEALKEAEGS